MGRQNLAADALRLWGADAQINMMIEECGELIVALQHLKRGRITPERVAEEIADVTLMMDQATALFPSEVASALSAKTARLFARLEAAELKAHAKKTEAST